MINAALKHLLIPSIKRDEEGEGGVGSRHCDTLATPRTSLSLSLPWAASVGVLLSSEHALLPLSDLA